MYKRWSTLRFSQKKTILSFDLEITYIAVLKSQEDNLTLKLLMVMKWGLLVDFTRMSILALDLKIESLGVFNYQELSSDHKTSFGLIIGPFMNYRSVITKVTILNPYLV